MRSNTCQRGSSACPFFIAAILHSLYPARITSYKHARNPDHLRVWALLGMFAHQRCKLWQHQSQKKRVRLSERCGITVQQLFSMNGRYDGVWCPVLQTHSRLDLHLTKVCFLLYHSFTQLSFVSAAALLLLSIHLISLHNRPLCTHSNNRPAGKWFGSLVLSFTSTCER